MSDIVALKESARRAVDARAEELKDLSRRIHANPELGFQEFKAQQWQAEALVEGGFEVEKGTGGVETAFRAVYRGPEPGPAIAVLSQYDAMPGIGHGCSHNIIAAASVGAALAIKETCPDLPGQLEIIGCPAEEGGGGKILMLRNGAFQGLDAAIMVHGHKRTMASRKGIAAVSLRLKFFGKASHAASAPTQGISALDAVIHTFVAVNSLRQFIKDGSRVHGIITKGGDAPNIIPAYAEALFLVRADTLPELEGMKARLLACAEAQAMAVGARLEVEEGTTYAERVPNQVIAGLVARNLQQLGFEAREAFPGGYGSSDFANVGLLCPIANPYLKIVPENISTHTPEFAEASGSEVGMQATIDGAKLLAMTVIDLCYSPESMAAATAEWTAWKAERDRIAV